MKNEALYDRGYLVNFVEGDRAFYRTQINYPILNNDKYHVIKENETLLSISQLHYGYQHLWYVLADVNASLIEDIFDLPVGESILIPNMDILETIYG